MTSGDVVRWLLIGATIHFIGYLLGWRARGKEEAMRRRLEELEGDEE